MARSFAAVEDYEARYGAVGDRGRVGAFLEDASALMESAYMARYGLPYLEGAHRCFDLNARAVCCAAASRALSASALYGVSQRTETAGSYSDSVTYANPSGDLYLARSDLKRLGLWGSTVRSVPASTAFDGKGDDDAL